MTSTSTDAAIRSARGSAERAPSPAPCGLGQPRRARGRLRAARHTARSWATNLVAGDTNSTQDIFVHDFQSGLTSRVSVDSAGGEANGYNYSPSISADGRYVAFASVATNLVPGDTNANPDIF